MIEIEKPRIETEELSNDGTYGRFVVEPLERGFGNTLGSEEYYFLPLRAWPLRR